MPQVQKPGERWGTEGSFPKSQGPSLTRPSVLQKHERKDSFVLMALFLVICDGSSWKFSVGGGMEEGTGRKAKEVGAFLITVTKFLAEAT